MSRKWKFTTEPNIFINLDDVQDQYPDNKVTTQPLLGLIPHQIYPTDDPASSDQRDWVRLAAYVRWLNDISPENVQYKILYLTRHGFGFHNKLHAEVGHEAWERKWSFEYGNETETWFDAHLTDVGKQQAKDLNAFWKNLFGNEGAPHPGTVYTSPLARCLQTTDLILRPLILPFQPIIKEGLRERITQHKCDFRRPRTWIAENFPDYAFEEGFAEEDGFGGDGKPETDEQHRARKQTVLEEVWEADDEGVLWMTVHSYAIRALQRVCGAEVVRTREGTSVGMLVRGERVAG